MQLYENNGEGTLNAGITAVATSLTLGSGEGANFPAITAPEWYWGTLEEDGVGVEIVRVTARSTDTFTVVRAQQGTTGLAFTSAATFSMRATEADFERLASQSMWRWNFNGNPNAYSVTTAGTFDFDAVIDGAHYVLHGGLRADRLRIIQHNAPTSGSYQVQAWRVRSGTAAAIGTVTLTSTTDHATAVATMSSNNTFNAGDLLYICLVTNSPTDGEGLTILLY